MAQGRKRRVWSDKEKRAICAQTRVPGVSVSHLRQAQVAAPVLDAPNGVHPRQQLAEEMRHPGERLAQAHVHGPFPMHGGVHERAAPQEAPKPGVQSARSPPE